MNVIFEFLSNEPIENLITSMHFRMGKAIYYGYHDTIEKLKDSTANFLKKYCEGEEAVFHAMSHTDVQSMMKTMRQTIEFEIASGNSIYFDMTGGEDAILTAFGMLAGEYDTPMHAYDIRKNKISKLEESSARSILNVEPRPFRLDLDKYIEMHGGKINYNLHKSTKDIEDPEFAEDIMKIWSVEDDYTEEWNLLSIFLRTHMMPEDSLEVSLDLEKVENLLKGSNNRLNTLGKFNLLMDRLGEVGILQDLRHSDGVYSFRYKSNAVRECLRDGGSTLELYIYKREQEDSDDCKVGVHLDWDGVLHYAPGIDVLNEVDVLVLRDNVPTFISCKTGKMGPSNTLHALYELQTVADRFGGKYAKKLLVTSRRPADVYLKRAEEMGIEVEPMSEAE